jgi:asparagine synthase (glutamine-hydrolysing)
VRRSRNEFILDLSRRTILNACNHGPLTGHGKQPKRERGIPKGQRSRELWTGHSFSADGVRHNLCGITGFTHRNGEFDPRRICVSVDSLVHRGPDENGAHQTQFVSLGAVRLKIVDLRDGQQPMFSDDGDTVLIFNGEIYNHAEIRRELETLGHCFLSRSDTEVVLRAFLQWDTQCFRRFRGMFALAIWSESERRLLLARDRLGIKPLYIHRNGRDIYFASELKALFAHSQISRELDRAALEYFLMTNYVPGPWTMIRGIEKLPPGHLLEWRNGNEQISEYWRLRFRPLEHRSVEDAQEELDGLLQDSVREHLISDVPLGIWLSGGIDSSTILHYARQASPSRLRTFSITFQGYSFDETQYIREVANYYGTEHHELDLNPGPDLASAIEDMAGYLDEPMADAGAVPAWFLSRLSRQHVTVALSGEGADEIFGGYLTYRADVLARKARLFPHSVRRGVVRFLHAWPVSDEKIGLEYKLKRFFEGSLLPADEAHTYWNGSFSEGQQRLFLLGKNGNRLDKLYEIDLPCQCSGNFLNRYLAFDQRYYLPDDILQKVDRMSMAHSLEVRPPFLDHRIVEFAATLPPAWKIDGRRQKVILRNLMKRHLPPSVLQRPKIGLDIPTHNWLRGALRPLLLDTLTSEAIEHSQLFRRSAIQRMVSDHCDRRANLGFHLWGLLILFLWIKRWNIQTVPTGSEVEAQEGVLTPVSL